MSFKVQGPGCEEQLITDLLRLEYQKVRGTLALASQYNSAGLGMQMAGRCMSLVSLHFHSERSPAVTSTVRITTACR